MVSLTLSPHELGMVRCGLELMRDECAAASGSPRLSRIDRSEALAVERRVRALLLRLSDGF